MYRCQLCGKVTPRNMPAQRLVTETRVKTYPKRRNAQPPTTRAKKRSNRENWRDDPGGTGREIAREVVACVKCVKKHAGQA